MGKFEYRAASVACRRLGGVMRADFYGPLCEVAYEELKTAIAPMARSELSVVLRMDKALLLMTDPPQVTPGLHGATPPCIALVVDEEHLDFWGCYSKRLSSAGVISAVFVSQHLELAMQWAQNHAC